MSDALSCGVLGWAEIEAQRVEMLPARTVLSSIDSWYFCGSGDDGGSGGDGGDHNKGGDGGQGGDGGNAYANVSDNVNNGFMQINIAIAEGGDGGDANGGDVDANGGQGGTDKA
ncbi:MAG: hypothetical protein LC799_08245 [Actinobacteria bacterium]|nr:hypothetical protein [Actinomycetota bacterium]